MAIRKAVIIESDIVTPIFAKRFYGSKIKYIKHTLIPLDGVGIKFKFTMEIN